MPIIHVEYLHSINTETGTQWVVEPARTESFGLPDQANKVAALARLNAVRPQLQPNEKIRAHIHTHDDSDATRVGCEIIGEVFPL